MEFLKFVDRFPSNQAALDIFAGHWASKLPETSGHLVAGTAGLFDADSRPGLAARAFGDASGRLDGMRVCELGPLEGGHTYQLEAFGSEILAIEGNAEAYLKCLIVKEILGLKSRFLLGNFMSFLAEENTNWDMIFASGVLYHMVEPLKLIELICRRTDRCFLWSHYYDAVLCSGYEERPGAAGAWTVPHFHRAYGDRGDAGFLGGLEDYRCWLRKEDIIRSFQHFGHGSVEVVEEDLGHPYGPCFSLITQRV